MKQLILSGGRPTESEAWVRALLSHAGSEARVALCMFAAPSESQVPEIAAGVQAVVAKWAGSVQVSFQQLTPASFTDVSAWANVVVIPGGDPEKLKSALEPYGDLMQLWDNKTISGSSAGADIMCRRYVYLQDKTFHDGFGWIPANFIPHWQATEWPGWGPKDWEWAAAELAAGPGETPLIIVREGEFVEIAVQ